MLQAKITFHNLNDSVKTTGHNQENIFFSLQTGVLEILFSGEQEDIFGEEKNIST